MLLNPTQSEGRWLLYRLLADPARLRLLALAAEEELSVGELAELLDESQPNVSRQAATLRQGGLVTDRRQGTRSFVRLAQAARLDAVVVDAIAEGRRLCVEEERFSRIASVVRRRDERAREYFEQAQREPGHERLAPELPVYVLAVSTVTVARDLAVDAGTGDGAMLDVLAPYFRRVVAIDRSQSQLERARLRVSQRGYENVDLVQGELDDREVRRRIGEGANVVFASRMLHHAVCPRLTMSALSALLLPGGQLVVVDYQSHEEESFREQRANVWMGFSKEEVVTLTRAAGLIEPTWLDVPKGFVGGAIDGQVPWYIVRATHPAAAN